MASPSHSPKASKDLSTGDAHPQDINDTDLQMDLNDHPTVQHSSEAIQNEELDEEPLLHQLKNIIEESTEEEIVQPIEPSSDAFIEALVEGIVEDNVEK